MFTHGNGFTVSPVNTTAPTACREYFISDLGPSTRVQGSRNLGITAAQVRDGIPIGRPALYFGALPSPYALAPSKVEEFDYPQGDDNFYTRYSGAAGVAIGHPWQRLAASLYLAEPKLLSQGALSSKTRLLLRREVRESCAPWRPSCASRRIPTWVGATARGGALPGGAAPVLDRGRLHHEPQLSLHAPRCPAIPTSATCAIP